MDKHGDFIWYELMTTDWDSAQTFYGGLLGWDFQAFDESEMDYRLITKNGVMVAGLLPINDEMQQGGARPAWSGYIAADDVDSSLKAATDIGAELLMPPQDIPGVGRFAFLKDPQGAMFYMMQAASGEPSESFSKSEAREGHCAWNELLTSDPAGADSFYHTVFGWDETESMDLGPMGKYAMYRNDKDRDFLFGAIMPKPDEMPISLWTYYFRVPDIDSAVDYVKSNKGQTLGETMEIPGGDFVTRAMDPQGALFCLIGSR